MSETTTTTQMDDASLFSSAMEAETPAQEPVAPEPEPQPQPDQGTQPRDEHGRFAVKAGETATQPVQPATEPQPGAQPPAEARPAADAEQIPSWRLREVSERARQAEQRAAALENQLQQAIGQLRQHTEKQTPPPDFYLNPEEAMRHGARAEVQTLVDPRLNQLEQHVIQLGRMYAGQLHGEDKIDAAEKAFLTAVNNRSLHPADYDRVVNSPNRYDAVVKWHRTQTALATVGDDPEKWFMNQLGERAKDPQFQAQLMTLVRGNVAQPGNGARPQTTVQLPPSLSRVAAAAPSGPDDQGDLSDQSLYRHAMR